MTAMPASPATRRMVTAARPSASAIRTAIAVMAARSCRGLGPRDPCSGRSQTDAAAPGVRAARAGRSPAWPAGGSPVDVITGHSTFHRAPYVVSWKRRTVHDENTRTAAVPAAGATTGGTAHEDHVRDHPDRRPAGGRLGRPDRPGPLPGEEPAVPRGTGPGTRRDPDPAGEGPPGQRPADDRQAEDHRRRPGRGAAVGRQPA